MRTFKLEPERCCLVSLPILYVSIIGTFTKLKESLDDRLNYSAGFSATILQFKSAIFAFSAIVHDSPPV